MLKFLFFITVIALCNGARIPRSPAEIETVRALSENGPDGAYNFMYEGSDGSYREEKAVPMNVGEEDEYLAITGSYKYISAEGKDVEVHYTADTRGFIITGQTIHDNAGPRQSKSIQTIDDSSNKASENPKKSVTHTPPRTTITSTKSIPESPPKEPTTESSSQISEGTSETSNESSSQASNEDLIKTS